MEKLGEGVYIGIHHSSLAKECLNLSHGQVRVIGEKASQGSFLVLSKRAAWRREGQKDPEKETVCTALDNQVLKKEWQFKAGIEVLGKFK